MHHLRVRTTTTTLLSGIQKTPSSTQNAPNDAASIEAKEFEDLVLELLGVLPRTKTHGPIRAI